MDSKTFYLKYRPQKLAELDLVEIREELSKIVKSGKIPHALLFVGPQGTGKTSAARIIAKAVNCEHQDAKDTRARRDFEPCNRCKICEAITNGTALDLIEIDAASNRGIDDIRNLREKIKLSPARCRYKVYIIDEVHMLTTEAFNALLKTLEEPPAHAIFILCTTAPEKLPKTIISRCLRFNFRKGKPSEVMTALERAAKEEKLKIEKGVLEEISKDVDGSFRDAHKILEQLALEGEKITLLAAKKLLGQIEGLAPDKLLKLMAAKKTKAALQEIDRIVKNGGDLMIYSGQLLDQLRLGMLAKLGLEEVSCPEETKKFSLAEIKILIRLFFQATEEIKFSPIPQLPLELVVVEYCEKRNEKIKDEKLVKRSKGKERNLLARVKSRWTEVLASIRPLNHSVEALLRASRPLEFDGERLVLEVFYKFHKERLETEKCRRLVEKVTSQVLERPIKLQCVLGAREPAKAPGGFRAPNNFGKAASYDIIKAAEEIFSGKLID